MPHHCQAFFVIGHFKTTLINTIKFNGMTGFKVTTSNNQEIHFEFYLDVAPVKSRAF